MIIRFSVSVVCALHLHLIVPAGDWVTDSSEKRGKGPWLGALIWHHYLLMTVCILTKANGRAIEAARLGRGTLMSINQEGIVIGDHVGISLGLDERA
jgi:hypothetical protein